MTEEPEVVDVELAVNQKPEKQDSLPAPIIKDVNMQALFSKAVDAGAPLEVIDRLVALEEKMYARRAEKAFYALLTTFQGTCPEIPKTHAVHNKDGTIRYRYPPLEDICDIIRPALMKYGLSFRWDTQQTDSTVTAICYLHGAGHSISSSLTIPIDETQKMNAAQQTASALSYAKRYTLLNVLGIQPRGEDPDVNDIDPKHAAANQGNDVPACPHCGKFNTVMKNKYPGGEWYCNACREQFDTIPQDVFDKKPEPATSPQRQQIHILAKEKGQENILLEAMQTITGRPEVSSTSDLTKSEASAIIDELKKLPEKKKKELFNG